MSRFAIIKAFCLTLVLSVFAILIYASITSKDELNCSTEITDPKVGFMDHGTLFTPTKTGWGTWLVRVNNPQNWDYNEYFTGSGWSVDKKDAMNGDSCTLKQSYFEYLENIN